MRDFLSEEELLELQRLMIANYMSFGISEPGEINPFLADGLFNGDKNILGDKD